MSLNLIPLEKIKTIRREETLSLAQNYAILLLIVLAGLNLFLILNNREMEKGIGINEKIRVTPVSAEIKNLNSRLSEIARIQNSSANWSAVLNGINETTPGNIRLSRMETDKITSMIILAGTAPSRDDLLNYRNRLAAINYVKNVELPPQSLLQKDDVRFELTMSIDFTQINEL